MKKVLLSLALVLSFALTAFLLRMPAPIMQAIQPL